MKRTISQYWFIIIFILSLLFPVYGKVFDRGIELSGVTAAPDKVSVSAETLGDGTLQTYLNDRWENGFPGRKFLLRIRNQLLFDVFRTSPNKNVIIGKDNYLYEPSYILFETQAFPPCAREYFETLAEKLKTLDSLLAQNGKELYVFITPSKAHFCRDKLSDLCLFLDSTDQYSEKNYDNLLEALDRSGVPYYDSVRFLEENKNNPDVPMFYASGIHWSRPWGNRCAANFLDFMNGHSRYDLGSVTVSVSPSAEPVSPDADLYASLNLIRPVEDNWYTADTRISRKGIDKPKVFFRGGSFMGQSLNALVAAGVFSGDVHFENNYYFTDNYSNKETLSSNTAYDEIDLNRLVGQSDILVLEVNEAAITTMSWGFIETLLEHPEYLDNDPAA